MQANAFASNPTTLKVFTFVMVGLLVASLALFVTEVSVSDLQFDTIKACKATSATLSAISLFVLGPLGLWLAISQSKNNYMGGLIAGMVVALTLFVLALALKSNGA
jgi:hypothetical protein